MPLHKGEVRYLGHRPELEAGLYAIRPTDGTPPIPLGRLIAQASAMLEALRNLYDIIENEIGYRSDSDDAGEREYARRMIAARAILRAVEEEPVTR
jgi:hypothetical protein